MKEEYKYSISLVDGKIVFNDYMGNTYHYGLYKLLNSNVNMVVSATLNLLAPDGNSMTYDLTNHYNDMYHIYDKGIGFKIEDLPVETSIVFGEEFYVLKASLSIVYNRLNTDVSYITSDYYYDKIVNHNSFKSDIIKELATISEVIVSNSIKNNIPNYLLNSFNYYIIAENAMSSNFLVEANDIMELSKKQLDRWKMKY